jgi:hypothetical protein
MRKGGPDFRHLAPPRVLGPGSARGPGRSGTRQAGEELSGPGHLREYAVTRFRPACFDS